LESVHLLGTVAKSFTTVIAKDSPLEGHLLSLFDTLYTGDTSHQLDVLTGRVEKGVSISLEVLNWRACDATDYAV
jgi:hypothetical protein